MLCCVLALRLLWVCAEEERDTASVTEMADAPECTHKMADATTHHYFSVNRHDPSLITAVHPESCHITADLPESCHISADLPESCHITADLPESCHVLSATPRYSRSVLQYPSRVSSVRDAPLVSARAAGIPKPTHSSPPVSELILLTEVLPIMGIAFGVFGLRTPPQNSQRQRRPL